jgi:hypothetical protein
MDAKFREDAATITCRAAKPNKFGQARARRRGPQHAVKSIVHFAISQITMQQPTQEELQYLGLVRDILENGERRPDR